MFRFLLSRRWVLFALFVVVLGAACWRLGVWQFDRLQERHAENAIISRNLGAPPVPATRVMEPDRPLPAQLQWRRVTATGTFDQADETIVRYQTLDGRPGAQVVTPLRLETGASVLVDRGWFPTTNDPTAPVNPPDPAPGTVTVVGWAVPSQDGDPDEVTPLHGEVRLISSSGFAGEVEPPLLQGYISARAETPAPQAPLVRAETPVLDSGPHFFYGLQWWFFAALAVGGFVYFAYAEAREQKRGGQGV